MADALETHVATIDVPPQTSFAEVIVVDSPLESDAPDGADGPDVDEPADDGCDDRASDAIVNSDDDQAAGAAPQPAPQAVLVLNPSVDSESPDPEAAQSATDSTASWESHVESILQELEEQINEASLEAAPSLVPRVA